MSEAEAAGPPLLAPAAAGAFFTPLHLLKMGHAIISTKSNIKCNSSKHPGPGQVQEMAGPDLCMGPAGEGPSLGGFPKGHITGPVLAIRAVTASPFSKPMTHSSSRPFQKRNVTHSFLIHLNHPAQGEGGREW